MKKNIKEIEMLIETCLDSFAYPDGVREFCNEKEIDIISVMGDKIKEDLKLLNRNSDLTFAQIEKYYHALMDSYFGEKIIEKAEVVYGMAFGYDKDQVENFIDSIRESIEYGKEAIIIYKKMMEEVNNGKKVKTNR